MKIQMLLRIDTWVCLFGFLVLPMFLAGQDARTHELRFVDGADALTGHVQKLVHEHISTLDEKGRAAFSNDMVKVKLDAAIGGAQLLASLNALGVGTFELLHHRFSSEAPGMPEFIGTGGPEDEAAHEAAKNAWREAHPEAYQQYLDQLHNNPPPE